MQATAVNGRTKIKVNDTNLSGKFLKIELYSSTGVNLGTQYIEIGKVKENEGKIEVYEGLAWLEIIARKLGMLGAGDYGKDASVSFEDGALLKVSDSGEILYEICGD